MLLEGCVSRMFIYIYMCVCIPHLCKRCGVSGSRLKEFMYKILHVPIQSMGFVFISDFILPSHIRKKLNDEGQIEGYKRVYTYMDASLINRNDHICGIHKY
jgi:hypothetical protein